MNEMQEFQPLDTSLSDHEPMNQKTPSGMLNLRQFRFIEYFFQLDFDVKAAARAAGYPEKSLNQAVTRLMENAVVAQELTRRMILVRQSTNLRLQDIVDRLWEEANSGEGKGASQSARVNALKELCKVFGGHEKDSSMARGKRMVVINMNFEDSPKQLESPDE